MNVKELIEVLKEKIQAFEKLRFHLMFKICKYQSEIISGMKKNQNRRNEIARLKLLLKGEQNEGRKDGWEEIYACGIKRNFADNKYLKSKMGSEHPKWGHWKTRKTFEDKIMNVQINKYGDKTIIEADFDLTAFLKALQNLMEKLTEKIRRENKWAKFIYSFRGA